MSGQCQRVVQDRVQQMNPFVRVGLRQAKQLTLHGLSRILPEVHQNKEQFVFGCRERAVAVGGVSASSAVIPLNRLGLQRVLKAGRKARDELLKFSMGQARQGDKFGLILVNVSVPEHTTSF